MRELLNLLANIKLTLVSSNDVQLLIRDSHGGVTIYVKELILVLFVRLFDLRLFDFVCFLFLLVPGKGCGL